MDVETVDREYQQLEQEAQQVGQGIQDFATKLQAAGNAGDANAKEWILDLKSLALQIQQEQLQVQSLLQALHGLTVNTMQQVEPAAQQQAPMQANLQQQQQQPQGGGGMLHGFMSGNFGQAMTTGVGMGAGFGIADSLINSLFN